MCELEDNDNARINTQSFAVTTAWNRIELTFAADTSDPLDDDNAKSLSLNWWFHAGSTYSGGTFASNTWADTVQANRCAVDDFTSIFDATSRTFFITGVQMELGDTATPFEHRTYGTELALCQRYYERVTAGSAHSTFVSGFCTTTTASQATLSYSAKRAVPTITFSAASTFRVAHENSAKACTSISASEIGDRIAIIDAGVSSGLTAGQGMGITANNDATAYYELNAEL